MSIGALSGSGAASGSSGSSSTSKKKQPDNDNNELGIVSGMGKGYSNMEANVDTAKELTDISKNKADITHKQLGLNEKA